LQKVVKIDKIKAIKKKNMNLKQYLSFTLFSTLLAWLAWVVVILNINPFETSLIGFIFFYTSLFLALIGSISLIIFLFYKFFAGDDLPLFKYVMISLKQSLFTACFLILLIFLQMKSLLTWFNFSILIIIFILIISFTITIKKKHL